MATKTSPDNNGTTNANVSGHHEGGHFRNASLLERQLGPEPLSEWQAWRLGCSLMEKAPLQEPETSTQELVKEDQKVYDLQMGDGAGYYRSGSEA